MTHSTAPNFSLDLRGEVALVTGATAGLGHRFAQILASCGAEVAITGRRIDRLTRIAQEIRSEGGECEPIAMDMTDREQIRAGLRQAESALGTVTILVNNAGVPDAKRATRIDDALFDRVMNTNLGGGRGFSPAASLYTTTKGAIVRMTEALAVGGRQSRDTVQADVKVPCSRSFTTPGNGMSRLCMQT